MMRYTVFVAAIVILALAAPGKPVATSGNWTVDTRHSDVQFSTDGTSNFGKAKTTFTVGFARAVGIMKLDGADGTNSEVHIDFYPATAMTPTVDHDGKVNREWFEDRANNMMICFHSKGTKQTADGRVQTTGTLGMIRVDRNVELTASEAYAGPVYGPPIENHVSRTMTLVFDVPAARSGAKGDPVQTRGAISMAQEDFPQLFRGVFATQWPAVIQDKNCRTTGAGEAYGGDLCSGTFLLPSFPGGPGVSAAEDYPGAQNFNSITGKQLTIAFHLRLRPAGSGAHAAAGN